MYKAVIGVRTPDKQLLAMESELDIANLSDKWVSISASIKVGKDDSFSATGLQVFPQGKYLLVKRRWYHSVLRKLFGAYA